MSGPETPITRSDLAGCVATLAAVLVLGTVLLAVGWLVGLAR